MKKITSRMVAAAAGVSQATVSKVINNHPDVACETREKVIITAQKLNYRNLPRNGCRTVAVIVPNQEKSHFDGYAGYMLTAIGREITKRRMRMEIVPENDLAVLNERYIDGAVSITWGPDLTRTWPQMFNLPLVRLGGPSSNIDNCYSVNMDGRGSMEDLIERLWRLGHRKIGFITFNSQRNEEVLVHSQRLAGFLQALQHHGLGNPGRYCLFDFGSKTLDENCVAVKKMVASGITALICVDEEMVGRFYQIIYRLNLKIPQEVSLIGWERIGVSEYLQPPLTSMMIEYDQFGKMAVDLLDALTHPQRRAAVADIKLRFRLIERESLGPAPKAGQTRRAGGMTDRIIHSVQGGEKSRNEIATELNVNPHNGHFRQLLRQLVDSGILAYSHPKVIRSPHQKFHLSPANQP